MIPTVVQRNEVSTSSDIGSDHGLGKGPVVIKSAPISYGISVTAIRSFYDHHVKDKMKAGCTTGDVLTIVKAITKTNSGAGIGQSYCQMLRTLSSSSPAHSSSEVGPATVFISHAWKYNFHEFLVALEAKFKDQPLARLWIDLFCQNQHEELTSDDWITQFEQHIVRISYTVMIVFPWNDPIPFNR